MPTILYEGKGEVSTMYLSLGKRTIRLGLFCYKTENSIFHIVNIVVVSLRPLHSPTNPASANHPLTPGNGQEGPCLAFGYKSFSVPTLLQYTAKNAFFSPSRWSLYKTYKMGWNRLSSSIYRKVASSRPVYYSILNSLGQRSEYISIKFPLHKQSENAWVCY